MKGKGFLKGVQLGNFLDTTAEVHALVQGFTEVLCPWPPRHRLPPGKLLREIADEHHYYMVGRALGVLAWIAIATTVVSLLSLSLNGVKG